MYAITPNLRDAISALCREFYVAELLVFGSAVRDDFDPARSHLDLLVTFEQDAPIGLLEFASLEGKLGEGMGRKVDLISKRGLKPRIRDRVLAEAKPIYAR
jgi:uncharacterized protein